MKNQINTLENLHNKINNDVMGPIFYNFLEVNVPKHYDTSSEDYWNPMINLSEYLSLEENNVFGITNETEYKFFMSCIFNDDFEAFLNEENETNSSESDWNVWVDKVLSIIQK